jgi:hypothetical protein
VQPYLKPFLSFVLSVLVAACPSVLGAQARLETAAVRLLPESERSLGACLVGVEAEQAQYFMLPVLADPPAPLPAFEDVRRQLYWLNLELSHGQLFKDLSATAQLYVAMGRSTIQGSHWRDESWFKEYLRARCGWSAAEVSSRLHFFTVPDGLIWTQDATVLLGDDSRGRHILALDEEAGAYYKGMAKALAASYPDRFTLKRLPPDVSAEGGDLTVVRRPDGRLVMFIGRHRVLDWIRRSGQGEYRGRPVPQALVGRAVSAYADAYRLPVQVLPVRPLLEGWGSEDLFHLDMVAAFLSVSGRADAVVPSMLERSRDALTNQVFSPEQDAVWKRELDEAAAELKQAGYHVERAPLGDNPVRSPANTVRFDPGDGGPVEVLLSRYPDQSPGAMPSQGALEYQSALSEFRAAGDRWNQAPLAASLPQLQAALRNLWRGLARCKALGNPVGDAQARAYRDLGCRVKSLADYPWGAGGFHCQFLH